MMTQFFNSPFQKYPENRVELQEIEQDSPTHKNYPVSQTNTRAHKLKNLAFSALPHQIQSIIQALLPSHYKEELNSLRHAQFLKVKNTQDKFFGETTIVDISTSFFKHKATVAHGLCQIYFERGAYLVGYFENGKLEGEFVFVLENGNYIKARPRLRKPKRSVSGFITDDSDQLDSNENSSQDDKIQESDIRVQISDRKPQNSFSNLQCQMSFNGVYYKGCLKKGLLNSFVMERGKDYTFEGYYVMGQRKRGKMVSIHGFEYEGTFKYNKFDGLGTLKTKDGIYSGQFKNGLKDGEGEFTWSDGSFYKGDFRKDERHGRGFFKSNQGSFKGQWKNDQIEGNGYLVVGNHGVGGSWNKSSYSKPNKLF